MPLHETPLGLLRLTGGLARICGCVLKAGCVHRAGTVIALIGTYLYTEASKRTKPQPAKFVSHEGDNLHPDKPGGAAAA